MKTTNYKYLLNMARSAQKASSNDNYYLNKLVEELKDKVIKEKSFKTIANSYLKEYKKRRQEFYGYYVIDGTMYLCDGFSFIKIYKNGNNAVLLKDFKEVENAPAKTHIKFLLDRYNNKYQIDITNNLIEIDIMDLLETHDNIPLSENYTVDLNKLLYFAQINQHTKLNIHFDSENSIIYVLSECYSFLGMVMPCSIK